MSEEVDHRRDVVARTRSEHHEETTAWLGQSV